MSSVAERSSRVTSTLIDHIARVDLRVRDVEKALTFYRDVVGLEVDGQSADHASLSPAQGSAILTLDSTGVTAPADPRATGLFHTAIRFPTRASLGDVLARLVAARLEIGAGDHLVSEALYIDDPDGNGVELYWDRPESEWPSPTDDMLVPMATLPVDLDGLLDDGTGEQAVGRQAPQGTDIGHVHLQVSDLGPTTRFYRDEIGLDLTGSLGADAGFFSSNGYHHHIGANRWRSRGGKPSRNDRAGLARVVFAVADDAVLDGLGRRLKDAGREMTETNGRLAIHDPDGIELEFVSSGSGR
ncbi:MAG: catechol 2,3-dioxygenase [Actinomycetota bacterium]|jgi:catechol 2,3-dioxygenase|nr:catechol 2,3-dioxygenase [Actinomycetota bacterium]